MQPSSTKFRKIIWIVFLAGGSLISVIADVRFFSGLFYNPVFHLFSFLFGVVLLRAVITIARNTGKTLAKYGRKGELPRFETNELVTKGVYAYMRHPMHLGLLFFPLSIAFLIGSPTFIIFTAPAEAAIMLIMIKFYEEKEAINKFGEKYLQYMKSTPAFCLKPKCLKALFRNPFDN